MRQFDAHMFELAGVEVICHFGAEGVAAREDVEAHVVCAQEVDGVEGAGGGLGIGLGGSKYSR